VTVLIDVELFHASMFRANLCGTEGNAASAPIGGGDSACFALDTGCNKMYPQYP